VTQSDTATRTLIVEREFPHPPEKVWRALTESPLIEQWLMKNDFKPLVGHSFSLHREPIANWDGVIGCRVLELEPLRTLSYTWNALGSEWVVKWMLTPTAAGTHLRMEQSGFRVDQDQNYKGAMYGWQKFIGGLERVVAGL